MRVRILPYKTGSKSARELSQSLGVKRLKLQGSRFRPRHDDLIVNWGRNECPAFLEEAVNQIVNPFDNVKRAGNKEHFFRTISEHNENVEAENKISIPEWTTDRTVAEGWKAAGSFVVCRTMLRASGGRGIVLSGPEAAIVNAPLYTRYAKKRDEFRVHVIAGEVVHVQQKRRRRGDEEVDSQIRNHDNGWVFTIHDVEVNPEVVRQATLTVAALGLDFGAVDIIWNAHYQKAYVLEVNCAPGLEGTTLEEYDEAFRTLFNIHAAENQ